MTSKFSIRIMDRGFQNPLTLPPMEFVPERYSFHAIGGPKSATIQVKAANERAVWELLEYLRCPVEIFDDRESCVWWGYINSVEINVGSFRVGVSLNEMYNQIAVIYSDGNSKATTTFAYDSVSVATYGVKELIVTLSDGNQALAEAYRDKLLSASKFPIPIIDIADRQSVISATIECSGWFSTFDWRYYSRNTEYLDVQSQITEIVSAAGQFFTGVDFVEVSSTPISNAARDGNTTALSNIRELVLGSGLLAKTTRDRRLVILQEPVLDPYRPDIYLLLDGSVQNIWGDPYYATTCPVGIWARLKDVIPGSVDLGLIADPTMLFIEEAEYDIENRRYLPVTRMQTNPLSVGTRMRDG